jgi:hypothetical protein
MALHPDAETAFSPRDLLRSARRRLGLSPMQRLLRRLRRQGVELGSLNGIELFSGSGKRHTLDYASRIGRLEAWEIDPTCEAMLRRNVPNAAIRIVDTYQEIRRTSEHFDLIVVDNPATMHGGHFEHFDLFPDLFRLAGDSAVVLINVIPRIAANTPTKFPNIFDERHLAARRQFYKAEQPENLSWTDIVSAYRQCAQAAGFEWEWSIRVRRHFVYYFAFKIRRLK